MLLTKFEPFKDINNFYRLLDTHPEVETNKSIGRYIPQVNTREGEFAYHIDVDLPGMNKEDICINIDEKSLTVTGERKYKEELTQEDYYKIETSFGKFERVFTLPEHIDEENIIANSVNGVLEIVIPKLEKTITKKRIEIK